MKHGSVSTYVYHRCRCDECRAAKSAADREYYQRNKERVQAKTAEYNAKTTEEKRAWHKENYQRNKELIRRTQKEYQSSPKGRKALRRGVLKRRARKHAAFVEHVDSERVLVRDLGVCGICGEQIEEAFHVDHILPLSRGGLHSYANVQLAHPRCNFKKAY